MKNKQTIFRFIVCLVLRVLSLASFTQSTLKSDWADWDFLIGEWTAAESSGVPGSASAGGFTLTPDLGGKILLRKTMLSTGLRTDGLRLSTMT